jgi:hypothetical protein
VNSQGKIARFLHRPPPRRSPALPYPPGGCVHHSKCYPHTIARSLKKKNPLRLVGNRAG